MKYFLCIFIFISFSLFSREEKHELCICSIFQNDARFLKEWIDFHRKQGVDHFYLYNNNSTDNPKKVLQPYINARIVTLINWNLKYSDYCDWNTIQCQSYLDCVRKIQNKCVWCAFLDTDEFLFNPDGENLKTVLKDFKKFSGVIVNWVHYGSSGVEHCEFILNSLVMRAKMDFSFNSHVKTICRPKHVLDCRNPHWFIYKMNHYHVDENMKYVGEPTKKIHSVEKLRINHYWSRDMDFFLNVKLPRRNKWTTSTEDCLKMEGQMNDIYDPILSTRPW